MKPHICIIIIGLIILIVIVVGRLCKNKDTRGEKPSCKGAFYKKGRWICPAGCNQEEKPVDCEDSICIDEQWLCLDNHNQKILLI